MGCLSFRCVDHNRHCNTQCQDNNNKYLHGNGIIPGVFPSDMIFRPIEKISF